jgi:hypothetical protein
MSEVSTGLVTPQICATGSGLIYPSWLLDLGMMHAEDANGLTDQEGDEPRVTYRSWDFYQTAYTASENSLPPQH